MGVTMPATPELDKQRAVAFTEREPSHVLSEFYDWLQAEGIEFATWGEPYDVQERCPTCDDRAKGIDPKSLRRRHKDVLGIGRTREERRGSRWTGLTVGESREYEERLRRECRPCPDCDPATPGFRYVTRIHQDRLTPLNQGPERLFARFFGIDLDKIEAERRAILEAIRA